MMNGLLCNLLVFGVVGLSIAQAPTEIKPVYELPTDIPTCSEKNPNINECIRAAFQQVTPRLKDGIKELNIPPMDPYLLEKATYQYANGILVGRITMKNLRVYGISEGITENVDFKQNDGHISMDVQSYIPRVYVEGNYKADMKFNDIKMTPKGYFNVTMTNVTMKSRPEGELYESDGHTYIRLTKFQIDPNVGDMRIYANGLFPDPALNDVLLDFINQYWRQIYKVMLPETRSTWEPFMIKATNEVLATLPYDLFLTKN